MNKKSFILPVLPATGTSPEKGPDDQQRLPTTVRLAYSLGHVFNDLCASLWFSYFLLYLNSVLMFKSTTAGILLLIGQVVDAMATPLVGWESDRRRSILSICCLGYGKRKSWHMLGTILVVASFPFMFQDCLVGCSSPTTGHWSPFLYYAVLISIFQVGWAAVQVSHVALITDLTPDPKERITLNVYRHMATVTSNIIVYGITWLVFHDQNHGGDQVGAHSSPYFRTIVLAVGGTGITCSVIFHLLVREGDNRKEDKYFIPKGGCEIYGQYRSHSVDESSTNIFQAAGQTLLLQTKLDNEIQDEEKSLRTATVFAIHNPPEVKQSEKSSEDQSVCDKLSATSKEALWPLEQDQRKSQLAWRQWLTRISFYQVATLYVASRLYVNLSQVYMALYLQYTLALPKETLAIVPLVVNVSGLLFAFLLKPISFKIGNKNSLVMGCLIGAGACVWVYLFVPELVQGTSGLLLVGGWQVYAIGALLGLGGTTLLVASLAITADLIGTNTRSSAFVFGVMSLFDKLASGGAILVIQYIEPFKDSAERELLTPYYREVLVYGCGVAVFITIIGLFTTFPSWYKELKKNRKTEVQNCQDQIISKEQPVQNVPPA